MNLRILPRTLVIGAFMLVATSVIGGSSVRVQAQDNNPFGHNNRASCEASGYLWVDGQGCADNYCLDGLFGYGDPGETQMLGGQIWMCDGFSGQWIQVMVVHPTNPRLPQPLPPVAIAPVTSPTPVGTKLPVHGGAAGLR